MKKTKKVETKMCTLGIEIAFETKADSKGKRNRKTQSVTYDNAIACGSAGPVSLLEREQNLAELSVRQSLMKFDFSDSEEEEPLLENVGAVKLNKVKYKILHHSKQLLKLLWNHFMLQHDYRSYNKIRTPIYCKELCRTIGPLMLHSQEIYERKKSKAFSETVLNILSRKVCSECDRETRILP